MRRPGPKKDDDHRAPNGLSKYCDARGVCWSLVIPIGIIIVIVLRSQTSAWGLKTSSARALRMDQVRNLTMTPADPPDTDPAFDPEGDAARYREEVAAKAQKELERAERKRAQNAGNKARQKAAAEAKAAAAKQKADASRGQSGSQANSGGTNSGPGSKSSGGSKAGAAQQQGQSGGAIDSDVAMMSVKVETKQKPQRRRKTDTKFLVVPAHKCQLLDDPLANACMYGGMDAARQPECQEAVKGQASNSYLPAFTRIAPLIAGFGPRRFTVAPVWDGSTEESQQAWQEQVDDADVLVLDELAILYLGSKIAGKKLIALQHNAAASLRTCSKGMCAQRLLQQDQLLAYLQHTSLRPLTRNNANRVADVVHYDLLDALHQQNRSADDASLQQQDSGGKPAFSSAMLAKVHTIIPMIWRWRFPITCRGRPEFTEWMMKPLQGGLGDFPPYLRPIHERPVDIAFYGRLTPDSTWEDEGDKEDSTGDQLFRLHRQQLFDSLTALGRDAPEITTVVSESVEYDTFAQGVRNTKLFISPLGKAEASGKDYEAIISRAVLIKPLASSLESYPNIYEPEVTCVEVKADYSDLEGVVKALLGNPERMQRIADTAFQRLLLHSQERTVAQDVAEVLMNIVEEDDPAAIVYID